MESGNEITSCLIVEQQHCTATWADSGERAYCERSRPDDRSFNKLGRYHANGNSRGNVGSDACVHHRSFLGRSSARVERPTIA